MTHAPEHYLLDFFSRLGSLFFAGLFLLLVVRWYVAHEVQNVIDQVTKPQVTKKK